MPKDTQRTTTTDHAQLDLPERVTVAVAELASAAREGLLALAVGTGLQVLQAMLAEDVARLVGPKGRHNPDRAAVRHGAEPGQVTLGGRRVRVRRPRVRSADGTGEVAVSTYQAFASTELLGHLALEWTARPPARPVLGAEATMAEPAGPMTFRCPLAVRSTCPPARCTAATISLASFERQRFGVACSSAPSR